MATNENVFDHPGADRSADRARFALHPLHEAALRITELGLNRPKEKTKDLIGLLLCHGARAWRYSQPPATIHLHVARYDGRYPVVLRMK